MPQLRQSPPDGAFVAMKNGNAGTIAAKRLLKLHATEGSFDLATAVSDKAAGISVAATLTTAQADVQTRGLGVVTAGAAVAIGDRITTDGAGKGVAAAPAGGTNNAIWGVARTAASGIDVDFEIELWGVGATFQG